MYIYVFLHVFLYVYTYLCICIYTYICILTYGKTYTELQPRVYTWVWRAHINLLHFKNTMQHSATHQSINHHPKANLGSDLSRPRNCMCVSKSHELILTSYVSSPIHIWHTNSLIRRLEKVNPEPRPLSKPEPKPHTCLFRLWSWWKSSKSHSRIYSTH